MTRAWPCDSLQRVLPSARPRLWPLRLDAARGERFSFQAAVIPERAGALDVRVEAPDGLEMRVRRAGLVPLPRRTDGTADRYLEGARHIPGLVPDPLFEDLAQPLPPRAASAFWISGRVALDCRPGLKTIRVRLAPAGGRGRAATSLQVSLRVHPLVLPPRRNFDVYHWFYADALCDWYRVAPWGEDCWRRLEPYLRNLADHEQNVIYTPLITPPLDGVKRPTQLLGVRRTGRNRYAFDWRQVARWVRTARRCGLEKFEWSHLFTQWGVQFAPRIYQGPLAEERLLWPPETPAASATYRAFLAQLLPQWQAFLVRENVLERSLFHLSDEPHGDVQRENYRWARQLLRELAPWMRVMDAISEPAFALEKLVDLPVAIIDRARDFAAQHIPCSHYYCCWPRGAWLNRLLETPLAAIRLTGWLLYRFRARGFLHWGYNYWYQSQTRNLINPFFQSDGLATPNWAHGDPFVVYPGPAGPLDSLRWEVFAESLQDYRLLQALDIAPESLRAELRDYNRFPRQPDWLRRRRRRLLETARP